MNYFCNVENIGNGRFADKVLQEIILKHAGNKSKDIEKIVEEDIPTIKEIINSKERNKAGKTLPPQGLYLVKVEYN